jgi:hypothetical protein
MLSTKIMEAHLALLSRLPSKIHEHRPDVSQQTVLTGVLAEARKHGARPIVINGRTYPSITKARAALRVNIKKIYDMLDTGDAEYVKAR